MIELGMNFIHFSSLILNALYAFVINYWFNFHNSYIYYYTKI